MVEISQAGSAINERHAARPGQQSNKPRRGVVVRVEKRWPRAVILGCQFGILAGILLLWEIGVRVRWVDPFFWSQPSAIWSAGITFVMRWSALYDTWFTVSSTLIGFVVGTA